MLLAFIIIPTAFISLLNFSNASGYLSGAQLAEMVRLTIFLIIVTALLGGLVAISVAKSISDPIHALHKGTEIIGDGNLEYKVGTPAKDEIGQLSRAFDQMTGNLKRLEEEAKMKGMLLDDVADSIIVHDLTGRIIYANQKAADLRGYTVEELIGKDIHKLVVPEDIREIDNRIKDMKTNGEVKFESTHMRRDGTTFHIEIDARLVNWQGRQLVLRVGHDITERKRMEGELRESESLYHSLFDSMLNGFAYCKMIYEDGRPKDFIYLSVNGTFATLTGLENVAGKKFTEVLPGVRESNPEILETYDRVVATGKPEIYETYSEKFGGWLHIVVYRPQAGHFVAVFENITERKRAEEKELELVKARELDRLKSLFIASMSHELRTPLNSIIGFTGILLMGMAGDLNEEQKTQLTMVKTSAGHLLILINDVIDISKIEAEKIQLSIEEFDLSQVVKEVKDSFAVVLEEKGLKLNVDMPDKAAVKSDERRVKQIVMNMVSNAIKFTSKGEIGIRVEGSGERVSIIVTDTGVGIKKEDMSKLFKQFSRITVEGQPLQEGTGLGLYLSQKLARVLGGEIKAESEFGKGSVFTFTLPLEYREIKA